MKHNPNIRPIPSERGICLRLEEVRRAWKLSQEDVAVRIGIATETFRKYELGVNRPSLESLLLWADVLGYSLSLWPKEQK